MVQYLLLWLKIWSFQSGIFVSNLYIYKRQSSFLLELSNKFWAFIYDVTIFSLFVENSLPLVTIFLLLWAINLSSIFDPSTLKVWDVIYGWPFLQVSSFNFIHSFKTWIYNNKYLFLACYILKLHILHCFWDIFVLRNLKNSAVSSSTNKNNHVQIRNSLLLFVQFHNNFKSYCDI